MEGGYSPEMWIEVQQNGEIIKSKIREMNSSSDFNEYVFKNGLAIDSLQVEGNSIKEFATEL